MITDKIELTYIPDSKVIKIYIEAKDGQDETVEAWFNSFWNHGATQAADLNWTNKNEGYFWTSQKKLKRYFKNSSRAIVLNELGEDWGGDFKAWREVANRIADLAQERFEEL